jgi:hypothetical protein
VSTRNNPISDGATGPSGPGSPTAAPNAASFAEQSIQPPSALYVQRDDVLILQAATSQVAEVVTVNIRLLRVDGSIVPMQFQLRPLSTRAVITLPATMAEGWLLSLSATAAVATTRGQTFLRAFISRGAFANSVPGQLLIADYVTTFIGAGYPGGRILAPTEGPGLITTFFPTPSGAGLDFQVVPPPNTRWKVRSIFANLITSATVANRNVQIVVVLGASISWQAGALAAVTAGQTVSFAFGAIPPYASVIATDQIVPLPPDLFITQQGAVLIKIGGQTVNIQAGDQWNSVAALVEEWLDNV